MSIFLPFSGVMYGRGRGRPKTEVRKPSKIKFSKIFTIFSSCNYYKPQVTFQPQEQKLRPKLKCQVLQYPKKPNVRPNWRAKRGTLPNFLPSILLQNVKKIEGGPFGDSKIFSKKSQCRKKLRGLFSLARYCMLR